MYHSRCVPITVWTLVLFGPLKWTLSLVCSSAVLIPGNSMWPDWIIQFSYTQFILIRGLKAEMFIFSPVTRLVRFPLYSTSQVQLTDTRCPQFTDRPACCRAQRSACGAARHQQMLQVHQSDVSRINVRPVGMCKSERLCVLCWVQNAQ